MLNESQLQKKMQKAISLKLDGFTDQAVKQFEFILKERPYYLTALLEVGDLYLQTMQYQKAKEVFEKSLQILDEEDDKQQYAYTCVNLAGALQALGYFDLAGEYYRSAGELEPLDLLIKARAGRYLSEVGRGQEALDVFESILAIDHRFVDAICGKAEVLVKNREFDVAAVEYKRALLIKPNYYVAIMGLVTLYLDSKQYLQAKAMINKGLGVYPEFSALLLNKSRLDLRLGDLIGALDATNQVLSLNPSTMVALKQKAWVLTQMQRFDEAIRCYDMMMEIVPNDANALYSKSMVQLTLANFAEGWFNHEARLNIDAYKNSNVVLNKDSGRWHIDRALTEGESLIVYSEQGLGDTIQFSRYVALLKERKIPFKLSIQPALRSLFKCSKEIASSIIDTDVVHDSYFIPLMSLPYEFKTDNFTIPEPLKFEFPQNRQEFWHKKLKMFKSGKRKIGLVTTGNLSHLNDFNRSIDLQSLCEYLPKDNIYFLLQKDLRVEDAEYLDDNHAGLNIYWIGREFSDFVDTAVFCSLLDEVITVGTSLAHLCGSLNIETVTLLPFVPDWRWQRDSDDTPWYKSMQLMRQPEYGNWKSVFERLAQYLISR